MNKRRWAWLGVAAAIALAAAGITTRAMAGPQRSSYTACIKHAQSTADLDRCVGAELRRLRPLLAAAYAGLANDGSDTARHRRQIVGAERAWETFVARDCAYAGGFYAGGTLQPVAESECRVQQETRRLADLRRYARGPEG
jgi:uncharacterized protein YecT (DUF1311 family)